MEEKKKKDSEQENQAQEPEIKEQEQSPTPAPKKPFPTKIAIIAASAVAVVGIGAVALVGILGGGKSHNHSFGEWATAKEATCETNGVKERFCSCGEKQTEDIFANGHSFGEWTVVENATCGSEGSEKRECSCGEKETRSIEKHKSHDNIIIDTKIEATCKDTGLTEGKHCTVCNEIIIPQTEISKSTNHTYTDKYDAICNVCNYERDPDCAHTNKVTVPGKNATCTEDGYTDEEKCAKCGEVLIAKTTIKAKGHTKGSWLTDKQATCLNEGLKHQECSVCHATVDNETIAPLGHTESGWITEKDATCTAEGSKYKKCTLCNEKLKTDKISKKSHTESGWITDKEATCTTDGSKHTECTVCLAKIQNAIINKLPHREGDWIVDKNATCIDNGSKHKECSECGNKTKTESIAKLGHLGGEWIYDKQPTCTESGARHKLCSRCNNTFDSENVSAIGHKEGNPATEGRVEAKCTEDGYYYEVVYCSATGCTYEFSKTRKTIESTGHNYSNGYCTKCSAVDPYPGAIRIYSYTDLVNMKNNLSATYVLMNDIDCQGLSLIPIGDSESNAFSGLFDGQGYIISNYISSNADFVGIFGYNRGTIKNLNIKDFVYNITSVSGNSVNIGGIVGYNAGVIERCTAINGKIEANMNNTCRAGLISGYNAGNITNCLVVGSVYVKQINQVYDWKLAGGITAANTGKIENCLVEATVYSYGKRDPAGGVYYRGEAALVTACNEQTGTISNCVVIGNVTEGNNRQGDICGRNDGKITNCYRDINVVLGGSGTKHEYATAQSLSTMSSNIFYSASLGWDSSIWDFTNVNLANKVYPKLIQN